MFNRKPKVQPRRGVEFHDVHAVRVAIDGLTRATVQQRLEIAALRRVIEQTTGYENPVHARMAEKQKRLEESNAQVGRKIADAINQAASRGWREKGGDS